MQKRYRPNRNFKKEKRYWYNENIRIPQLRVIGPNGENLGILETAKALAIAREAELDLVEVNPIANPPVAKIMDLGQFKYEQEKKEKKAKSSQKKIDIKGVRLTFRIKGNDLENRKRQTVEFLSDGDKVKIDLILKGREKAHKDLARNMLQKFLDELGVEVKVEAPISEQGGRFSVIITK